MPKPYTLHLGDCLETLRTLPDNSVDSIVTDPPYGLSKEPDMAEVLRHWLAGDDYQHKGGGFMGKTWDSFVPGPSIWRECLRVLKPGGHLLAFFGTRTQDIGTLAIRLAGFEIRDSIAWVYGSGFPKSMDVSKAIDKAAGAAREVIGPPTRHGGGKNSVYAQDEWTVANQATMGAQTAPATENAKQWEGWGTALKPALEPITVARKPLAKGCTVAANVLTHGTGALNIDGCRVGTETVSTHSRGSNAAFPKRPGESTVEESGRTIDQRDKLDHSERTGRWPANLIHDNSDEVVALFPANAGASAPVLGTEPSSMTKSVFGHINRQAANAFHGDNGSAARFFYAAKASRKDRHEGLDDPGEQFKRGTTLRNVESADTKGNNHPTVKPTDLMAYLCRLVTPPGGLVLDPFMGSGSTGKAAMREGFQFIGCELSPEYLSIAEARIEHELAKRAPEPAAIEHPEQQELFAAAE